MSKMVNYIKGPEYYIERPKDLENGQDFYFNQMAMYRKINKELEDYELQSLSLEYDGKMDTIRLDLGFPDSQDLPPKKHIDNVVTSAFKELFNTNEEMIIKSDNDKGK